MLRTFRLFLVEQSFRYDDQLKDVIRKILKTEPGERMPLDEIKVAVEILSTVAGNVHTVWLWYAKRALVS